MKIIKKRTLLLIVLCLCVGFYIAYSIFVGSKKGNDTWMVPDVSNISKKFITKETLISKIQQKQELVTMEMEMSEKVVLDDSWGNLSIFKKVQNIDFTGTGTYSIDLSSLKPENIDFQNNNKNVVIKIPAPSVKAITLDESKTIYETPDKGILRFGEIKLTPAESQIMTKSVKEKMSKKMEEPEYYNQAKSVSEQTLKNLVQSILDTDYKNKYTIDISFQDNK